MQRELTLRHYYTSSFAFCQLFSQHLLHQFLQLHYATLLKAHSVNITFVHIFKPQCSFCPSSQMPIFGNLNPRHAIFYLLLLLFHYPSPVPIALSPSNLSHSLYLSPLLFITIAYSLLLTRNTTTIYPIPHPPFPFVLYCFIYYYIPYSFCYYCLFSLYFWCLFPQL